MSCRENRCKIVPSYNAGAVARRRGPAVWLAVAVALATLACGHGNPPDEPDAPGTDDVAFAPGQGAVHGYVDAVGKSAVGLPDASIQLKRLSDNLLTATVITDVHGAFIASKVPAGTYVICITGTAGFSNACTSSSFLVSSGKIAYPPHAVFTPLRFVVYGRVRLGDGSDVRYENNLFGQEVNTFVRALTPGGALAAGPVRANGRGEYVLRQLASGTSYRIVVQSDATTIEAPVVTGTGPTSKDFLLPNRRPAVSEVTPSQGGKGVRHVAAGSVVHVAALASDPDGQALHYRWIAPRGGSCPATDASAVDCTMPAALGVQSIYVQVSDGAGQFSVGRARVSVGPAVSLFTGKLITDGDAVVAGAEVKVNGVVVTSNAAGAFSVSVPEQNRYVLTIKKDGFQLISKVFLEERTGATYRLRKAQAKALDPRVDNTILVQAPKVDTASGGYKDVTVVIKANSIVDAAGRPVTTTVTAFSSRFDHLFDASDRMPGDTGATTSAGRDTTLTSFGAIEVNLRGPAGEKYNIAPGMPADLKYEVHSSQLASAPPTIALWYYNEDRGLWEEDGTATLSGSTYLGQAKHFSAINVDLQKANATCLKLVVDETAPPLPFKIRLSVPGFPVRERDVVDVVSAIVRLPPNVAGSTIVVLDGSGTPISGSLRTFSTGDVLPDGTNLSLDPPYNVCITPPSPPVTLGIALPQNPSTFWLTRLINPGANDTQRNDYATAYYTAIQADATLTDWKNRNEFGAGDDAAGFFFNAGDLEFGRSMHMNHRSDGGIAYYVTNFATADKALGGAAGDVIATVAMEYSKFPSVAAGAPKFTKFYVFNKDGLRVNSAELDNRGDKYVPGLCVVCHGGTLPPNIAAATPPGNTESRFIPFDLKSYDANPLQPGFPAMLPRAAQEDEFRKLNEGVYLLTGATDAQKALIEAWYDPLGVSSAGQPQLDGIANIPFNWSSTGVAADAPFYYDVIRPSCRACHASRGPGLDFGDPASFVGVGPSFAVCNAGYMPQSFVTWRNFWRSLAPQQPMLVEQYLGLGAGTCVGP
jgi:hypothetical protein